MSAVSQRHAAVEDDAYASTNQDEIDTFLREEGVPTASTLTRHDITSALLTLGLTVAAASVKFVVKMVLRRLDTLACVEGELNKDAENDSNNDVKPAGRALHTSALGWSRHLYREDGSAATFLRGGWAEFGFVLATSVEETAIVMGLRAVYGRLLRLRPGPSRHEFGWVCLHLIVPMALTGVLSWPLRAVRTAVMVNYFSDTKAPLPPSSSTAVPASTATSTEKKGEGTKTQEGGAHRYHSAVDVWKSLRQLVGLRGLLLNGFDVDVAGRALSMTLVLFVVQPTMLWIRQVAAMRTGGATAPTQDSLLMRLGQYRYFNLLALFAVVGTVNTLQRPFVVLQRRMALLPAQKVDEEKAAKSTPRRGCRYASGWDCVCQVLRREGVAALFAGLPLCLLASTAVPLVITFAGYPTAPSFSGSAV